MALIHQSAMNTITFKHLLLTIAVLMSSCPPARSASCKNVCGDMPVMYPFGTASGCGSTTFQHYINCTDGKLQLYTPTGQYAIQSIDYNNNMIVIQDPHMSTCSTMQRSTSFGLPVDAPFSLVSTTVVLLGCSSASSPYNTLSPLCDASGTPICQSLYNCPSITQLGIPVGGPTSSCCLYSKAQLASPPYEINLQLLQCSSYTAIYNFVNDNINYNNPSSWAFGMVLQFFYDKTAYSASCQACEQTNGVCAYNVYGFVCVCSAGVNTTTQCYGDAVENGGRGALQILQQMIWAKGVFILTSLGLMLTP